MAFFKISKGKLFLCRLKPFLAFETNIGIHFQRFRCNHAARAHRAYFSSDAGGAEFSKWRKLDSRNLGITRSMISASSWIVIKNLRAAGFAAYLVGGCVRDLLINRVPKDFDVITTASLKQVKRKFQRAIIVGRNYPVCRVSVKGSIVEVTSFSTATATEQFGSKVLDIFQMPKYSDRGDYIRWKDSMRRDFTVNSLYFDPFVNIIFDYTNGVGDLRSLKLRTVIPAQLSFKEDKARILRGLRLAARLKLSFSKETETALDDLSLSITELSKSRILLEMNYMLAYGASEPSLVWLARFNLLKILLPFHAAYLSEQMDHGLSLHSLMLMKLFSNLDQLIACDRPCNDSLWVALLVFHLALFRNPQPAIVILTFASLLHNGTWEDSIKFSRENEPTVQTHTPEISGNFNNLSDDEIAKSVIQFARQVENSVDVLVNMDSLSEAMTRFPEFSHSGLVFVPPKMGSRTKYIFSIFGKGIRSLKADKRSYEIDYKLLIQGEASEIRFVLGKIILSSMILGANSDTRVTKVGKEDEQVMNPFRKLEILESTHYTNGTSMSEDVFTQVKLPIIHDNAHKDVLSSNRKQGDADSDSRSHHLGLDKIEKSKSKTERAHSLSRLFM
ncbi:uncharacterized protein LOC127242110 isoform X2 [Andrographis paniculata]|uniref:uncharacterized protein LOC127242110 isoform X2 n=1 Tax=Andrographis paniculata TaxID=175694 RepID=UPI0021E8057D|nr:uncharacterized protein LOC127242110 isoform X2 [Andrographis paniculata]